MTASSTRLGAALLLGLVCFASSPARGEEPIEEVGFAWPVATFELDVRDDAIVEVEVTRGGETTSFPLRGVPTIVLAAVNRGREGAAPPPTLDAVGPRVQALDADGEVGELAPGLFSVRPSVKGRTRVRQGLTSVLSGLRLELRVVVEPFERASPSDLGVREPAPRRTWAGTAAEYDEFLAAESARWQRAHDAGIPYLPSRPDVVVAPRGEVSPSFLPMFVVLEVPAPEEDFDGTSFREVAATRGARGEPVVTFGVRAARQAAFERWTRAQVGLPLALVLDGRVLVTPTLNASLRDSVQITLGQSAYEEARREAESLAASIASATHARLEVLAVAEPVSLPGGSGGAGHRRRLCVPLRGDGATIVRVKARDAAPWARVARHRPAGAPHVADAPSALLAALAVGQLAERWAEPWTRAMSPSALGFALLGRVVGPNTDELLRADALDLASRLAGDDDAVRAALEDAAAQGSAPVKAAATHALERLAAEARR
jgi:hypothetical protein